MKEVRIGLESVGGVSVGCAEGLSQRAAALPLAAPRGIVPTHNSNAFVQREMHPVPKKDRDKIICTYMKFAVPAYPTSYKYIIYKIIFTYMKCAVPAYIIYVTLGPLLAWEPHGDTDEPLLYVG